MIYTTSCYIVPRYNGTALDNLFAGYVYSWKPWILYIAHHGDATYMPTRCIVPDSKVHGANMGPTCPVGPRWAPCWPHEPCYLGCLSYRHTAISMVLPQEAVAASAAAPTAMASWGADIAFLGILSSCTFKTTWKQCITAGICFSLIDLYNLIYQWKPNTSWKSILTNLKYKH